MMTACFLSSPLSLAACDSWDAAGLWAWALVIRTVAVPSVMRSRAAEMSAAEGSDSARVAWA